MTNLRIANLDGRVEALLTNPDSYFAAARERAWTIARIEVDAELDRRAHARHNHHRAEPAEERRTSPPA
jgi:predicted NUDIX family NTP pyrophosphohydrolase